MKKVEWPGIATAATLVCALTIIVAIWRDPDGFRLKDWQTLMSAMLALAGGTLAYRGAMAKVDHDKAEIGKSELRSKTGVFMRLEAAARRLKNEANVKADRIRKRDDNRKEYGARTFRVSTPPEIDEAWENLHLFPKRMAERLANLRGAIDNLRRYSKSVTEETRVEVPPEGTELGRPAQSLLRNLENIAKHSTQISDWLAEELANQ